MDTPGLDFSNEAYRHWKSTNPFQALANQMQSACRRIAAVAKQHPEYAGFREPEIIVNHHPGGGDNPPIFEIYADLLFEKAGMAIFTMTLQELEEDDDHPRLTDEGRQYLTDTAQQAAAETGLELNDALRVALIPSEKGWIGVGYRYHYTPTDDAGQSAAVADIPQLAEDHRGILYQVAWGLQFRYRMPDGAQAAIDAGLVAEADPTWQYSDDVHASNSLKLTELGQQAALHLGWRCRCAGCDEDRSQKGWKPAIAVNEFCPNCRASVRQYGRAVFRNKPCCPMHRHTMDGLGLDQPEEPTAPAAPQAQVAVRWRWYKDHNLGWVARGDDQDLSLEQLPKPGDVITVLRRHGGMSRHRVQHVRNVNRWGQPTPPIAVLVPGQLAETDAQTARTRDAVAQPPARYTQPDTAPSKNWATPTPETEPIMWSWRHRDGKWTVTGSRPLADGETPPTVGTVITVWRRNRTWSRHPVTAHCGANYDQFPQLKVGPQVT